MCEGEYWSPEDVKNALNEHLALTTNAFWDANKHKFKGSKFKSSPRGDQKGGDSKIRHCYNCGGIKHFIAECPYENKEDYGGRFIPKRRSSKFSSKNQGNKEDEKKGQRLLGAHEEYDSRSEDDDESQDEESGEMATVAIVSSLSTSLFDSQNDNSTITNHKCLMAKATEVTPSPTPSSSHFESIFMDDVSSLKIKKEHVSCDEFLANLKGHTKVYFDTLVCQFGDAHDTIKEKEEFERLAADDIGSLSIELEEEQTLRVSLEEKLLGLEESHNLNMSKLTKERDHALAMVKVLKRRKLNLTLVIMISVGSLRSLKRPTRLWKASSLVSPRSVSNFKFN
jgi:hypothetical protein